MLRLLGFSHDKKKYGFVTESGSNIWVTKEEACQIVGVFGLIAYEQSNTEKVISCLTKPFKLLLRKTGIAGSLQHSSTS